MYNKTVRKMYCSVLGVVLMLMSATVLAKLPEKYGIFGENYYAARQILSGMTEDEKIAQVLIAEHPDTGGVAEMRQYQFGGYIFFADDFRGKNRSTIQAMIAELQSAAKIPLLTAVDEEGGSVVRLSQNSQLIAERFPSPQAAYRSGGLASIRQDTLLKSQFLYDLGLNLNLAPVVDVSEDPRDFMYSRSLGEDAARTAEFARTVIEASKGTGVSYTLKHFPGYGNNVDTHVGSAFDERTYEEIMQNDLLPFRAGITAGAEAVLVSHNTVTSIDPENPASLSPAIHQLLRDELGFSGVIITDEITMGALAHEEKMATRALQAGNDLIITRDAHKSFQEIKQSLESGELDEATLNRAVLKVIAWKLHKGLLQTINTRT